MSPGPKQIDTLLADIRGVFLNGTTADTDELCFSFGDRMGNMLLSRLKEYGKKRTKNLRLSAIGKSELQLWYEIKGGVEGEPLSSSALLKFLYGDILEELMLTLTEVAGHKVERRQETVELEGIVGHIDAVIDGELVDVKSASSYSFEKFEDGTLKDNDAFGYIYQIGAYAEALGKTRGYFLAVDKTLGHITLLKTDSWPNVRERIAKLKDLLTKDTPPEYACSIRTNKAGEKYLAVPCSYCPTKEHCCKGVKKRFSPSGAIQWIFGSL